MQTQCGQGNLLMRGFGGAMTNPCFLESGLIVVMQPFLRKGSTLT